MRGFAPAAHVVWLLLPLLAAGCGKNPFTGARTAAGRVPPPATATAPPVGAGSSFAPGHPSKAIQDRIAALEQENQQLTTSLANSQRDANFLKEKSAALRDELKGTTDKLARLSAEKTAGDKKIQSLEASTQKTTRSFSPNNGLKRELEPIRIQGVEARMDGDVVRVELPHEKLFASGGQTISLEGRSLIDSVIAELQRTYPDHIMGVEGRTASEPGGPLGGPLGGNAKALRRSLAEASAVFEYLTSVLRIDSKQLLIVAHGANHPLFSNATPAGRRRNNRVELVIYPERYR